MTIFNACLHVKHLIRNKHLSNYIFHSIHRVKHITDPYTHIFNKIIVYMALFSCKQKNNDEENIRIKKYCRNKNENHYHHIFCCFGKEEFSPKNKRKNEHSHFEFWRKMGKKRNSHLNREKVKSLFKKVKTKSHKMIFTGDVCKYKA